MLNISGNHASSKIHLEGIKSFDKTQTPRWHFTFRRLMLVLLAVALLFMFLPWTQSVRADGKVTTLRPEQRPQTIHSTIAGRIEKWYVMEGQAVKRGDTIVHLSEVKADYFDPQLVARMGDQLAAKENTIGAYGGKAGALENQETAMLRELEQKSDQIRNKIVQAGLKIQSDSLKLVQSKNDLQVAQRQFEGANNLYEKGVKSLTDLEEKRLKRQECETKVASAENQLSTSRKDLEIYRSEYRLVQSETANKVAKVRSERFSTLSDQYNAEASVSKLRIETENYSRRAAFYYVVAPQDGYVVKTMKPGIGEMVKEGDPVVSIQPAEYELAVEMYVKPLDVPLLNVGNQVRFIFDGWPSFFFSGWPGLSTGTFGGEIVAIDRNISPNGKFRMLVSPAVGEQPWPNALLPGGGAKGIVQLTNVPVWYEFWRVLNGFPPDMYQSEASGAKNDDKKTGK